MAGKVVDRRPVVRKKLLPGQGVGPIAKPLQKCNDEPRAGGHLAERDHYDDLDRGSHMDDEQDRKPTAFSFPPQTFDPRKEYSVVERRLPHWSQAGAIAFITWRTWDSMPAKGIDTWLAGRDEILKRLGAPVVISLREMKGHLAEQDEYYEAALQNLPRHLARAVKQAVGSRVPRRPRPHVTRLGKFAKLARHPAFFGHRP